MGKDKYRFALLKFKQASGWRGPKHRVAPCLKEKIREIEAVRACCMTVIWSVDDESAEGEALSGVLSILDKIKSDLYESCRVLIHELKNEE